ncbi:MAG: response regulator transcription factor [Sporichthyaceae bacterium]|nr:response regulator transcription factor [Sporichthyaceae bacterium]
MPADEEPILGGLPRPVRAGLAELLRQQGMEVAGEAADVPALLELVRHTRPDVVVVDVRMPPTHSVEGLAAARDIRAEYGTSIGILVLSHHLETRYAIDLLASGAQGVGYLLKDRVLSPAELGDAIRRVGAGGSAIDPQVIEHLLRRKRADEPLATLTPRERDVLSLVAEGRSNRSVAATLYISEKTVEAVTGRIFTKLGLAESAESHRRVQAVLAWLQPSGEAELPTAGR